MNKIITKTCKRHGELLQKDIGVINRSSRWGFKGGFYYSCLICKRINDRKFRERNKAKRGLTKKEKTKLILSRITTNDPARKKALVNVVRAIVDTYDSQFNQILGDKDVSNKYTRIKRKFSQNARKSIKR